MHHSEIQVTWKNSWIIETPLKTGKPQWTCLKEVSVLVIWKHRPPRACTEVCEAVIEKVPSWRLSTIVEEVIIKLTQCFIETAGAVQAVRFIGAVYGLSGFSEQCAKMVQERDNLGCDVMWVTVKTPKPKREQQWSSWRERWRQANNYGKELSTHESSGTVRGQSCNEWRRVLGLGGEF